MTKRGQNKKVNKKKASTVSSQNNLHGTQRQSLLFEGSPSGCSSVSATTSHRVTAVPSPNMTVAFYLDVFYVGPALADAFLCFTAEQQLHYV